MADEVIDPAAFSRDGPACRAHEFELAARRQCPCGSSRCRVMDEVRQRLKSNEQD